MPYYELLYETGAHSVGNYETDDEMLSAVKEHHTRATGGQRSLDADGAPPAERVVKVLKYDEHPGDGVDVDAKAVTKLVKEHTADDVVDLLGLSEALRDEASPTVLSGAHESNYKATEVETFEKGWES